MIRQLNILGEDKVQTAIKRFKTFEPQEGYYLAIIINRIKSVSDTPIYWILNTRGINMKILNLLTNKKALYEKYDGERFFHCTNCGHESAAGLRDRCKKCWCSMQGQVHYHDNYIATATMPRLVKKS